MTWIGLCDLPTWRKVLTTCAEIEIRVKWKVVRTFCNGPSKSSKLIQNHPTIKQNHPKSSNGINNQHQCTNGPTLFKKQLRQPLAAMLLPLANNGHCYFLLIPSFSLCGSIQIYMYTYIYIIWLWLICIYTYIKYGYGFKPMIQPSGGSKKHP